MIRKAHSFFSLIIIATMSCRTEKHTSSGGNKQLLALGNVVAWNEDTTNSYALILQENDSFTYTIVTSNNGVTTKQHYTGAYKRSADSVFLNYKNKPDNLFTTDYLVSDASGAYLIQNFMNTKKRVFLRIQRRPIR